jgi:hypothetical protein
MPHRLRYKQRKDVSIDDIPEWVRVNKMQPPVGLGGRVWYKTFGKIKEGEIIEIDYLRGEVLIFIEGVHQRDEDPYINGNKVYGDKIPYEEVHRSS